MQLGPGQADSGQPGRWTLGAHTVDASLPENSLSLAALHDVTCAGPGDAAAAAGFALALLSRLNRQGGIVWCQTLHARREYGRLYMAGLARYGIAPDRLILVDVMRERDLIWTMEETLRAGCLAAVAGESQGVGFTATRRLSLAAARSGTPAILINQSPATTASAAATRWRVAAGTGPPDAFDRRAPGPAGWQAELTRCRGGRPGVWHLLWNHETHYFDLATGLRHGAVHAQPAPAHGIAKRAAG